jgi:hypothetical protein
MPSTGDSKLPLSSQAGNNCSDKNGKQPSRRTPRGPIPGAFDDRELLAIFDEAPETADAAAEKSESSYCEKASTTGIATAWRALKSPTITQEEWVARRRLGAAVPAGLDDDEESDDVRNRNEPQASGSGDQEEARGRLLPRLIREDKLRDADKLIAMVGDGRDTPLSVDDQPGVFGNPSLVDHSELSGVSGK